MKRILRAVQMAVLALLLVWVDGCIRDEVLLPPEITSVSKTSAPSGEIVTINGNNFDGSLQVLVDNGVISTAGTPTRTEAQFIVPFRTQPEEVSLTVKTKYGASQPKAFTVLPPVPIIRTLKPNRSGIGTLVKIAGSYFTNVSAVRFKSSDQETERDAVFTVAGDTILVTVPAGLLPDAADIKVTSASGVSEPAAFLVLMAPKIISFTPDNGAAGKVIKLEGENLSDAQKVTFGPILEAEIITDAPESITVRVPDGAPTDTIYVYTPGGKGKTPKKFSAIPGPAIQTIDKTTGGVGTDVLITGLNFTGAFELKFGTTPAQIVSNDGTKIKTKVPIGGSSGKISVTTPAGTALSTTDFLVQGAPLISKFDPPSGVTGTQIVLTGMNLASITSAKVALKDLKIVSKTDTEVTVEVLAGTVTGKISVQTPGGTFETTDLFTVLGAPQITAVNPSSGIVGTVVTITGINLPSSPYVRFTNNIQATTILKSLSTQIICQVPQGASTGKINVNGALSLTDFVLNVKPIITSFTPAKGGVDTQVTINGSYLTGATVKFANNLTATKVGAGTDNQVIVKVPAGAVTGAISVTTTPGTTNTASKFEILSPPSITSFNPTGGVSGTSVTITGTNLQHNPTVQFFNGVNATVKSVSATQLVVQVPAGASTGRISVTTDAVQTAVASATDFTIVGKPSITSISPASGTVGQPITVNGTNFTNPITVIVNGTSVAGTWVSNNVVKVNVPVNSTVNKSVNVSVKTAADYSNNYPFLLLAEPATAQLKLKPNNNPVDWPVLLEGPNLGTVTRITLNGKVITPNFRQANAITFVVPNDIGSTGAMTLRLFYTSDISTSYKVDLNFTVLNAPPPGPIPPPIIILPPPPPVNLTTNIDADWSVAFNENNDTDGFYWESTVRLDTDQDFQVAGTISSSDATGSFASGYLTLTINGDTYDGQFYNNNIYLTSRTTGRQLVLGSSPCSTPDCK
ncbi:IPT/TIG domain-containing protein [Chryseolinea soli]|uniref:IPT/TIG domain-containing protein n=1 Tax=Chryseolinea soli TaxID=2321403 RepID=A0A385SSS2_9BACT|nr:IPT/TIG domain-containing protein [Chryseolinea soli]AYB33371.1 hypothetical protein D4L85_23515 [Chryseolinea soli]